MSDPDNRLKLFLAHEAALVEYAAPIVGDRGRAEDIVQEAFIRFNPGHENGGNPESTDLRQPVAYLYRIVRNLAFDWVRRRATERRYEHLETTEHELAESVSVSPEQEIIRKQTAISVRNALAMLDEKTRLALEMHRIHGKTLTEIAAHFDISVATAHRLIRSGIVQLTLALTHEDEDA
ncbi:sigma-70 family RNA polymerase sigma factor [Thalassospira sp. SN3W]|uniref:sigma-70 family RNA polymerase sigma factor n=1 Tax=Thalassospira sp. SN3W TaxID=3035476 RepID=UPI00311B32E7